MLMAVVARKAGAGAKAAADPMKARATILEFGSILKTVLCYFGISLLRSALCHSLDS